MKSREQKDRLRRERETGWAAEDAAFKAATNYVERAPRPGIRCRACSAKLKPSARRCHYCGSVDLERDIGTPFPAPAPVSSRKPAKALWTLFDVIIIAVVAFFVGVVLVGRLHDSPARQPEQLSPARVAVTAQCADGSYSFSAHASGTCSSHGGVATWINYPTG